jgi:hypothetical protein
LSDASNHGSVSKRLLLLEALAKDPQRQWLVEHPKLHWLWRIRELAPSHSGVAIHQALVAEEGEYLKRFFSSVSHKRKHELLKKWGKWLKVPNKNHILKIIQTQSLRTPAQLAKIRNEIARTMPSTRPKNNLSDAVRVRLFNSGVEILDEWFFRKIPQSEISPDELRDELLDIIGNETVHVRIPNDIKTMDELEWFWRKWITHGLGRFYPSRAIKKIILKKRAEEKTLRRSSPTVLLVRLGGVQELGLPRDTPWENVRYRTALTPSERKVVDFLKEGLNRRQIQVRMDISRQAVFTHIASLRKKAFL